MKNAGFIDENEEVKKKENEEMMEEAGEDDTDFFKLKIYENVSEEYSGRANIAKLILQQSIVNPIFGDYIKKDNCFIEFSP